MTFGQTLAGTNFSQIDTSPQFVLGSTQIGADGVYQYIIAGSAITANRLVRITRAHQADSATTTNTGSERRAMGVSRANLSSGQYGWVWRGVGKTTCLVSASIAAGTTLTTTATAGEAGTGGTAITGFCSDAATSGSAAEVSVFASGLMTSN